MPVTPALPANGNNLKFLRSPDKPAVLAIGCQAGNSQVKHHGQSRAENIIQVVASDYRQIHQRRDIQIFQAEVKKI
jgi:hypothetical protein